MSGIPVHQQGSPPDASDHFHVPEIRLVLAIHDAPSILDRLPRSQQAFISYIRFALIQNVKSDNVVYHGLAGQLLLKGIPHILKVRVIADLEDRVRAEMDREKISEDEARTLLLKDDEERRKWTRTLYGADPWDSSLYDLVVHIHKFTAEDAVDIICDAVKREPFKTTRQAQQKLEDYAIACEMKAALSDSFDNVSVKSEYGNILVYAKGNDRQIQRIRKKARKSPKKCRASTTWRFMLPRNCHQCACNHPHPEKLEYHLFTMRIQSCPLS